jgi:hypothetical protein
MDQEKIRLCKEWIARRTAQLDQLEKRFDAQYDMFSAEDNRKRLDDIEAARFWVNIHRWELNQLIGSDDDYPQPTNND